MSTMWFIFAVLTAFAWGAANLYYKKGSDPGDPTSHLKIVVMIGFVMGIHAVSYMLIKGITFDVWNMVLYFPVSFMYILSMTLGFVGLRYIELSIAAPVQNSAGAITAVLLMVFFPTSISALEIFGIVIVTVGVIMLARYEQTHEHKIMLQNGETFDPKYKLGFLAITFPILYALIDGVGSFLDGVYLDKKQWMSEDNALLAYEFTFLICAILVYLYLKFIKKEDFKIFKQKDRGIAALLETAGQFFYVFAMAGNAMIAAPLIASSGIFSVLLSRIFLKEVLSKKQYVLIAAVMIGIIALGIAEEL
ncbi:EamA family transporter [Savagea serpentis]|nr:EamA family transporter [Savagea serpentis]